MEDLLQSQIQDSCRLALPNGLKELMSDISREVLRCQPPHLFKFVTEYLSTLLVTRENLYVASKVCNVVYDCQCRPELEDELRYIGLDEQNASDAAEIIEKYIGAGGANEGNLLLKLVRKTSVDESQLPAVLIAIRQAFLRHQTNHTKVYESSSNSEEDETERAAKNTLNLYRTTKPTSITYNCMAMKIQASYRAYKVRRELTTLGNIKTDQLSKTPSKSESLKSTDEVAKSTDLVTSSRTENEKTKVTFGAIDQGSVASDLAGTRSDGDAKHLKFEAAQSRTNHLSSTSLAGSYLSLPQYRPYSAHDFEALVGLEETTEKERTNFDYTQEHSPVEEIYKIHDMTKENDPKNKMIVFNELPHDDDSIIEEMEEYYELEENIFEAYEEDMTEMDSVKSTEDLVDETIIEKRFYATDYAENKPEENITVRDKVDKNIEKKYIVDEGDDNIIVKNDDIEENIAKEAILEDIPEEVQELPDINNLEDVDIVEGVPEEVEELPDIYNLEDVDIVEGVPKEIDILDDDILNEDEDTDGNEYDGTDNNEDIYISY